MLTYPTIHSEDACQPASDYMPENLFSERTFFCLPISNTQKSAWRIVCTQYLLNESRSGLIQYPILSNHFSQYSLP